MKLVSKRHGEGVSVIGRSWVHNVIDCDNFNSDSGIQGRSSLLFFAPSEAGALGSRRSRPLLAHVGGRAE
jgi:hypothetical protein